MYIFIYKISIKYSYMQLKLLLCVKIEKDTTQLAIKINQVGINYYFVIKMLSFFSFFLLIYSCCNNLKNICSKVLCCVHCSFIVIQCCKSDETICAYSFLQKQAFELLSLKGKTRQHCKVVAGWTKVCFTDSINI